MTERFNVLVLGYGEMGHAMEHLLSETHELSIWEKYPEAGFKSAVLETAVPQADFVLFCLPVNPHYQVARHIEPMLKDNAVCLSIAKGLDDAGYTAAGIFQNVLGDRHDYVLVYGPMISEEIRKDRYAFAQAGCLSNRVYEKTRSLFSGTRLMLEYTHDIHGISWSVILKNVYAILFGIADELKLGDNVRGFLMVRSVMELDSIVRQMGGEQGASCNLAGLGDLVTTATSTGSHHHETGRKLARGDTGNISGEGIHTMAMVEKYRIFDTNSFPMFSMIQDIVNNPGADIEKRVTSCIKQYF